METPALIPRPERTLRRSATSRPSATSMDGIYSARMEEEKQCILVIVGATDRTDRQPIAKQSWLEVLLDLKRRGLKWVRNWRCAQWKALRYPGARSNAWEDGQRLEQAAPAKESRPARHLDGRNQEMPERLRLLPGSLRAKRKGRGLPGRHVLLTFYDLLEACSTTNPIESTFATVRLAALRGWPWMRLNQSTLQVMSLPIHNF